MATKEKAAPDKTTEETTAEQTAAATAQNAAAGSTGGAYSGPTDEAPPKTLAEARAKNHKADTELAEAQAKNLKEVAERDAKPKGEAKPSKRTEKEKAKGSEALA